MRPTGRLIHPLVDAGRMPHLKALVERGVMGDLMTLQPILSPILWTSIATGERAYRHGIHGFVEPTPDGARLRPTASTSAKMQSALEYSRAGREALSRRRLVCEPSRGADQTALRLASIPVAPASASVEHWPPQPNSVRPERLAEALTELRLHPTEDYGAMLSQFIPAASRFDQRDPERAGCSVPSPDGSPECPLGARQSSLL